MLSDGGTDDDFLKSSGNRNGMGRAKIWEIAVSVETGDATRPWLRIASGRKKKSQRTAPQCTTVLIYSPKVSLLTFSRRPRLSSPESAIVKLTMYINNYGRRRISTISGLGVGLVGRSKVRTETLAFSHNSFVKCNETTATRKVEYNNWVETISLVTAIISQVRLGTLR